MTKHVTIDFAGNIWEVTNLVDRFGNDTKDPILATACVIKLGPDRWLPRDTDDIPIYTVH